MARGVAKSARLRLLDASGNRALADVVLSAMIVRLERMARLMARVNGRNGDSDSMFSDELSEVSSIGGGDDNDNDDGGDDDEHLNNNDAVNIVQVLDNPGVNVLIDSFSMCKKI